MAALTDEGETMSSGSTTGVSIVGVGRTPIYRRGQSLPQTQFELACKALLAACDDAGINVREVDGFVYYGLQVDTSLLAQALGLEVHWTVGLTSGGGGAAGSLGVAAAAITSGHAKNVVVLRAIQQAKRRWGAAFTPSNPGAGTPSGSERDFYLTAGLVGPGQMFAPIARRHMHRYGTTREHFYEVVSTLRHNATKREGAIRGTPLSAEQYFAAPLLADPFCRYDFCVESDIAGAVILTSDDRAKDLRQRPVRLAGSVHGGEGAWGQAESWLNMPDELFATAGHRANAKRLFSLTGLRPADVDVAEIYDNFSSNVILQLEDYGFCGLGEGGPFVASGAIRWPDGQLPVNTHGGQLGEAFLAGLTHIIEGVHQLRGTATNQVAGAEVVLTTGGAAAIPTSGALLTI
jgi:acetyl-CoA acetyltransferase